MMHKAVRIVSPYDIELNKAERYGVSALSSLIGGSGHTTSNQTPWTEQIPYLREGFGAAQNLFQNYSPAYYPGTQIAPFSAAQQAGLSGVINQAGQPDPNAANAQQFNADLTGGKYLNSNPYMDDTAQSILSKVIPQVQSQFIQGNSMNNPSAAYATAQGATSALAPLEFGAYQQGIDNMMKGSALAPSLQGMSYFAPNMLLQAGGMQQQQQQNEIGANKNEWDYYQQLPYQQLQQFMSSIAGNYGGTTKTSGSEASNPITSTLGTLGGLSSLGGSLGGLAGGLGGLLAFL